MRPHTIRRIVSVDDTLTWLVLVTVLFLTTVWAVIEAGQRHQEYEMVEVVVRPGDTLWGLARQYAPDMDPREAVYIIRTANGGIDPGRIQPGDVLLIPMEVR
jgi:nucleoid-associated protein YgaU